MECVADNLVMSSLTCATTAPADLQHLRVLLVDMLKHVLPLVPTQFQRRKAVNYTLGEVIFMRIKGIRSMMRAEAGARLRSPLSLIDVLLSLLRPSALATRPSLRRPHVRRRLLDILVQTQTTYLRIWFDQCQMSQVCRHLTRGLPLRTLAGMWMQRRTD